MVEQVIFITWEYKGEKCFCPGGTNRRLVECLEYLIEKNYLSKYLEFFIGRRKQVLTIAKVQPL